MRQWRSTPWLAGAATLPLALCACTLLVGTSGLTGEAPDPSAPDTAANEGGGEGSLDAADAEAGPAAKEDPYVLAVLADKPLFYYRLDETNRTLGARDRAGTHNGLYLGNIVLDEPSAVTTGTSARFDGTSSAVLMGDPIAKFEGKASYTFEAWVKPSVATGYRRVLGRHDGINGAALYFSDLVIGSRREAETCGGPTLLIDLFKHIVVTFDGTTTRFYVNGVRAAFDCKLAPAVVAPSGAFTIGGTDGEFIGNLDEVAVYDFALSAERAQAHFAASGR